ncbi:MAG: bifunctional glutamate N-acetyltransferase/amino-acid acetyltransferase ArgJ [Pseudomonadota bacterium]
MAKRNKLSAESPREDVAAAASSVAAKKRPTKKKPPISPLAPEEFPPMPVIDGLTLGSVEAGVYPKKRRDLALFHAPGGMAIAGVFTQSKTASAPVEWCRQALQRGGGTARAIVVNAGNANAFTGKAGDDTVRRTVARAAQVLGCRQRDVFVASTGVICQPLTAEKIETALPNLAEATGPKKWRVAARAIMTTDTFPKGASAECEIDGVPVRIAGVAKGSGMIAPDMATMLAFVFTDAAIPPPILQSMLTIHVRDTFNAITVDSDTSTSDTLLLGATGTAPHRPVARAGDRRLAGFRRALDQVMLDLAHQVVRDGEGATKFVAVHVAGAATTKAARNMAFAIANSPLVKTAIAGEDPNWGRIVMAVGKSGEAADRDKLAIAFGPHPITVDGQIVPDYDEAPVAAYMKQSELEVFVDLGVGAAKAVVWTCDLTHGYISINADYRS